MRSPNARILIIALALIAAVALAGVLLSSHSPAADPDALPPAKAYLRVQVGSEVRPLIPVVDGGEYTVDQPDGCRNTVSFTAEGARMSFSTCLNQNCVEQGEVTLSNRDLRVLGSMIVCLPNQVIVELLSPEEAGVKEEVP